MIKLRGTAAVIGIGETIHRRVWPGRSMWGLCAEAAAEAIRDAGLAREDIDGMMSYGHHVVPAAMADYIGLKPIHFGLGCGFQGSSGGAALTIAAHLVTTGMANYVMFVAGGARDPAEPEGSIDMGPDPVLPGAAAEFVVPQGLATGDGTSYGLLYKRHVHQYGTKPEQLARIAVNQRFNAQKNPLAVFNERMITVEDVLDSHYVNYPLHLLECAMPVAGAVAFIVASAERARVMRQPPVYILGAGICQMYANSWLNPDLLDLPARESSRAAFAMSGYTPGEMQFAELDDSYTILEALSLEDAGICPKGESGPFFESTDTTYKGSFPINTDGGQLSAGQLNSIGASGGQHIVEATRQIRAQAGNRQVLHHDLGLVNTCGGTPSQMATIVLGSANAL